MRLNASSDSREEGEARMGPHDEFQELCANSNSGQLSEEEQNRLNEHLVACPDCREAFRDYESVVKDAIPAIGAKQLSRIDPGPGCSQSKAERAFFERLAKEEGDQSVRTEKKNGVPAAFRRALPIAPESTWCHVWMLYATGVLLFVTLCFSAHWVGVWHGVDLAKSTSAAPPTQSPVEKERVASLGEQLSDAAHERQLARAQIAERGKAVAGLHRQLQRQSAEIRRMKEDQDLGCWAFDGGACKRRRRKSRASKICGLGKKDALPD